jgi:hypothetical protein
MIQSITDGIEWHHHSTVRQTQLYSISISMLLAQTQPLSTDRQIQAHLNSVAAAATAAVAAASLLPFDSTQPTSCHLNLTKQKFLIGSPSGQKKQAPSNSMTQHC